MGLLLVHLYWKILPNMHFGQGKDPSPFADVSESNMSEAFIISIPYSKGHSACINWFHASKFS